MQQSTGVLDPFLLVYVYTRIPCLVTQLLVSPLCNAITIFCTIRIATYHAALLHMQCDRFPGTIMQVWSGAVAVQAG